MYSSSTTYFIPPFPSATFHFPLYICPFNFFTKCLRPFHYWLCTLVVLLPLHFLCQILQLLVPNLNWLLHLTLQLPFSKYLRFLFSFSLCLIFNQLPSRRFHAMLPIIGLVVVQTIRYQLKGKASRIKSSQPYFSTEAARMLNFVAIRITEVKTINTTLCSGTWRSITSIPTTPLTSIQFAGRSSWVQWSPIRTATTATPPSYIVLLNTSIWLVCTNGTVKQRSVEGI